MNIVLSWLKEFVDISISVEELAHLLTMLGLEVEEIRLVGLESHRLSEKDLHTSPHHEVRINGLSWPADKFVVAEVDEVLPHPNADRLVLCRLNDGKGEQIVLTGAPNLFEFKGKGPLARPLKVAYAREGSQLYDGHQPGWVVTTLKPMTIRGVKSSSMICSEKELGISEEHEGVIILDDDAKTGMPLVEYMGDAVLSIDILPNMIRNACVLGVAREVAATTHQSLRKPVCRLSASGASIDGQVTIKINDPILNPRFVLGLVRGVQPQPSPYWVQRRLTLAGMRPINSIVDATNYIMLEVGEPLHAFDYDILVQRAGGKPPTIITRAAKAGEKLTTLDEVQRRLDDFTILVTDTAGPLSLAGVMGGMESEVTDSTRNVLLEGATWNYINTRRTIDAQRLPSEASFRFSRGIHPELAKWGVELGLDRIAEWSGGEIAAGLVDNYPQPQIDPQVTLTSTDVYRVLGIELSPQQIVDLLAGLEFTCHIKGEQVIAKTPPHRVDIGEGVIGQADLLEEIARLYGYDNIPSTRMADELPPQRSFPLQEREDHVKDILVGLGLQEIISYRLTSPESVLRLYPHAEDAPTMTFVELSNPITPEKRVMRNNLLISVLEVLEKNSRLSDRLALFEIGPVFLPRRDSELPQELPRLAIIMTGERHPTAWDVKGSPQLDFYDLKGIIESLLERLNMTKYEFSPTEHISFHPALCAQLLVNESPIGTLGELHPLVKEHFALAESPVYAAELDMAALLKCIPERHEAQSISAFPPVLEDLAVIVNEDIPAARVTGVIRQAGGALLQEVRLFDLFRGKQVGEGKKSLAYSLTYQAPDRTLNDAEAGKIRNQIIQALEKELKAQIRSQ